MEHRQWTEKPLVVLVVYKVRNKKNSTRKYSSLWQPPVPTLPFSQWEKAAAGRWETASRQHPDVTTSSSYHPGPVTLTYATRQWLESQESARRRAAYSGSFTATLLVDWRPAVRGSHHKQMRPLHSMVRFDLRPADGSASIRMSHCEPILCSCRRGLRQTNLPAFRKGTEIQSSRRLHRPVYLFSYQSASSGGGIWLDYWSLFSRSATFRITKGPLLRNFWWSRYGVPGIQQRTSDIAATKPFRLPFGNGSIIQRCRRI